MDESPEEIDWTGVDEAMARQILHQGETYMQAQLQAALASDSRATTMAGIFVTLSLAVLAGGLGYWESRGNVPVLTASLLSGALLLGAAAFAAWAARPIDFYFAGNMPSQWFAGRRSGLVGMIGGEAENYDARISYNQRRLTENQNAIKRAFWLALAAPVIAAVGWLIANG